MSRVVKISAADLARILNPSLRDLKVEAARLATLERVRAKKEQRQAGD